MNGAILVKNAAATMVPVELFMVAVGLGVFGGVLIALLWCRRRWGRIEAHFQFLCQPSVYLQSGGNAPEYLPDLPRGGPWHAVSRLVRESLSELSRHIAQAQQARAALEVRMRRAMEQVRQAQMVLDLLPHPVVLLSGTLRVIFANRTAWDVLGKKGTTPDGAAEELALSECLRHLVEAVVRRPGAAQRTEEVEFPGPDGRDRRFRCRVIKMPASEQLVDKWEAPLEESSSHQHAASGNGANLAAGGVGNGQTLPAAGILSGSNPWGSSPRANGGGVSVLRGVPSWGEESCGIAILLEPQDDLQAVRAQEAAFLSAVAHEMKTPLAGIRAYAELLADDEGDDPASREEFLSVINRQVERLQRLVQNLLDLARIEAGILRVDKSTISLNEILEQAAEVVRPAAEAKSQHLELELSPLFLPVHVDRDLMLQVAINLLSNAIKYTPSGGRLILRSRLDDSEVLFQVEDTGVGLTQEECQRVFDRFYRVKRNEQMAEGTGLGLALVKSIVEDLHGGHISVESTLGKGTIFTVRLKSHQAVSVG